MLYQPDSIWRYLSPVLIFAFACFRHCSCRKFFVLLVIGVFLSLVPMLDTADIPHQLVLPSSRFFLAASEISSLARGKSGGAEREVSQQIIS